MNFIPHIIIWITTYAVPAQRSKMEVSHRLSHLKPRPECRRLTSPLLLLFSLQKIIHRNDGTESECTERDGWCLPKTSDDLRDSMSLMIKQIIRSARPGKDASKHITAFPMALRRCGLKKDVAVRTAAVAFLYLPLPLCHFWRPLCFSSLQHMSWGCCPAASMWVGTMNGWEKDFRFHLPQPSGFRRLLSDNQALILTDVSVGGVLLFFDVINWKEVRKLFLHDAGPKQYPRELDQTQPGEEALHCRAAGVPGVWEHVALGLIQFC